jgi:transposase
MAVYKKMLVDIPDDDGIHVKSAGAKNEKYVYKHVKYFRNTEGKPRNRSKAIGKLDTSSGKMFPNANYFELYNVGISVPDASVWDYGYSYLVLKACHDMGLFECLTRAFGEQRAMDIIVVASYVIREGNAMDGIDDWLERNYFPNYGRMLTSQSTSKLFAALTAGKVNDFFVGWIKIAMGEGAVCYDVTSISSYARQMPSIERGYNRDGEDLAQFNIGMFCDEGGKTPLYSNRYNGSLTDKTNLSYVLANARAIGIRHIKMVVDGGFGGDVCYTSLNDLCDSFIIGLPAHLKESQDILASHGDNIANYANGLNVPHVYCVSVDTVIGSVPGKALLYFDEMNHVHLRNELAEYINRLKAELSTLKRYPKSKLKRYEPYFSITKHVNGSGFDYSVDTKKANDLMKRKGYFLIFTTDMESTPEDTLYHYRAKDVIEKLFDQIKCDMHGSRIRTHNEQTTDGKVFITFIACIIRTYLLNKLNQYLTDNSTSLKKALSQLSNIMIITSFEGLRFIKALTKKQKSPDHHFKWWYEKPAPIRGFLVPATPKGVVSPASVSMLPLKGLYCFIPSSCMSVSVCFLMYARICSSLRPTVST